MAGKFNVYEHQDENAGLYFVMEVFPDDTDKLIASRLTFNQATLIAAAPETAAERDALAAALDAANLHIGKLAAQNSELNDMLQYVINTDWKDATHSAAIKARELLGNK